MIMRRGERDLIDRKSLRKISSQLEKIFGKTIFSPMFIILLYLETKRIYKVVESGQSDKE